MTRRLIILIYVLTSFSKINSLDLPLSCWRCDKTVQASDHSGVFFDGTFTFLFESTEKKRDFIVFYALDCHAYFDFTEHDREKCDGKCWKSVDLVDSRNNSSPFFKLTQFGKLKSSRRCFSATELIRAAEMGVNTSDGCRQVERNDRKIKEICFCSDQDMCNRTWKLTDNAFILLVLVCFLYI